MINRGFAYFIVLFLAAGLCLSADKAVTDDAIYDNVRLKLSGDPIVKGGAITVDVHSGVVTLGGAVEQERQKDKAAKLAKKVKGVKQVVNNLVIQQRSTGR